MSAELAFNRSDDVAYGVAEDVAPQVRRIVANNPSPYTFLGTNTYLVGRGRVAVIDPGPDDARASRGYRRSDARRARDAYSRHPQSSRSL